MTTLNDLSYSELAKLVQESAFSRSLNRSIIPFFFFGEGWGVSLEVFSLLGLFIGLFHKEFELFPLVCSSIPTQ